MFFLAVFYLSTNREPCLFDTSHRSDIVKISPQKLEEQSWTVDDEVVEVGVGVIGSDRVVLFGGER